MAFNTISIIGLGYIGLPTAAVVASRRKKVIGVDVSQQTIDIVNRGGIHIVEPELDMIVHAAVKEGYLRATVRAEPADAFLIAVPTPFKGDHEPDLGYIEAACRSLAPVLQKGNLVILESTSPVGTTEKMASWLAEERADLSFPQTHGIDSDIRIAYCPERVLPGNVIHELVENDRVIGGLTRRCSDEAVKLYEIFVKGECVITDARTAEMVKLTENSFRDVNIAFANELSIICDKLDLDVWELICLANRHPRVDILRPGPGVGGHCIAVDPWFIVSRTPEEARLIHTARTVNDDKPQRVIDAIEAHVRAVGAREIVCFGASFKPDIDDLRESAALKIIMELAKKGYNIQVVEPNIDTLPESLATIGCRLTTLEKALESQDNVLFVVLVAHKAFKTSDVLKERSPLDFCGILNRWEVNQFIRKW